MRKWFKRLAVVGGSLFILAMGFIVAEHARGRWSLRQHLCALVKLAVKRKPEPLVISQLVRQACVSVAPGWI